jgi:RNA polymerase sigma-70 factor, ECF subfamily
MNGPPGSTTAIEPHTLGLSWPGEAEVCVRFAPRIRALVLRHLKDRSLVDDIVQEVLAAVVVALREGRIESPLHLGPYVLSAARRRVSDAARTDYRRSALGPELELEASVEQRMAGPDQRYLEMEHLVRAMAPLSGRERQIMNETLACGRTADEIAVLVGTTPAHIRVLRHRALAKMRAALDWKEGA